MELELKVNNLFRNGKVFEVETDGEVLLLREPIEYEAGFKDTYHPVVNTDRIDVIAYKYYGKFVEDPSKYWWIIADANGIVNPLDLSDLIGTRILIPNIEKVLLTL